MRLDTSASVEEDSKPIRWIEKMDRKKENYEETIYLLVLKSITSWRFSSWQYLHTRYLKQETRADRITIAYRLFNKERLAKGERSLMALQ
jgi:hypothetical protein